MAWKYRIKNFRSTHQDFLCHLLFASTVSNSFRLFTKPPSNTEMLKIIFQPYSSLQYVLIISWRLRYFYVHLPYSAIFGTIIDFLNLIVLHNEKPWKREGNQDDLPNKIIGNSLCVVPELCIMTCQHVKLGHFFHGAFIANISEPYTHAKRFTYPLIFSY